MTTTVVDFVRSARRAGVSLIAIATPDQPAVIATLMKAQAVGVDRDGNETPVVTWDVIRGYRGLNGAGIAEVARAIGDPAGEQAALSKNPPDAMRLAVGFGKRTVVFAHNLGNFLDPITTQGIANLRDAFKADQRTLVGVGAQFLFPPELQQDVVYFIEPMPTDDELAAVASRVVSEANKLDKKRGKEAEAVAAPAGAEMRQVVMAVRGLHQAAAETVLAMAISRKGFNLDTLWERKKHAIEQTPGLHFNRGGPTLEESFRGYPAIAEWGTRLFDERGRGDGDLPVPGLIVFIDEIDKVMPGAATGVSGGGGDTSGVSQDVHGAILRWMTDDDVHGALLVSAPGCGKSTFARALGATHGVPEIEWDLGAMLGSLVGQSQANVRLALRVTTAVGGKGRILVLATCNRLESLSPELRRRFDMGIFYLDLPNEEARGQIWSLYLGQYPQLKGQKRPDDTDFTGADIRNVVQAALRLRVPMVRAANMTSVPVARADPQAVSRLRDLAHNRFLDAAKEGRYQRPGDRPGDGGRAVEME